MILITIFIKVLYNIYENYLDVNFKPLYLLNRASSNINANTLKREKWQIQNYKLLDFLSLFNGKFSIFRHTISQNQWSSVIFLFEDSGFAIRRPQKNLELYIFGFVIFLSYFIPIQASTKMYYKYCY